MNVRVSVWFGHGTAMVRVKVRMKGRGKVRMKRRKLATDPEVAFFIMTESRKVNMMMEMP